MTEHVEPVERSIPAEATAVCLCVSDHRPDPLLLVWHHIRPKGDGGVDTRIGHLGENGIWLCDTTHLNTHEILDQIRKARGAFTYADAQAHFPRPVSRYAYAMAREGWRRIVANEWAAA